MGGNRNRKLNMKAEGSGIKKNENEVTWHSGSMKNCRWSYGKLFSTMGIPVAATATQKRKTTKTTQLRRINDNRALTSTRSGTYQKSIRNVNYNNGRMLGLA